MRINSLLQNALVRGCWLLALAFSTGSQAADTWTQGKNYFLIERPRVPAVEPGKVEVTEVFSYACPACNVFQPYMRQLQKSLPANAVLDYLPASFNPSEDWPMFQLAFFSAQALGIAAQTQDAMFDAVWKTGELAVVDPDNQRIKSHLPTIEDAARFYNRSTGVAVEKFLSASKSFAVDVKVRSAEDAILAYGVDRTPTLVVNCKYRLTVQSAGGNDEVVELVKWLVAKETK
jgi:thiol:disulfide interchange protein DsbA